MLKESTPIKPAIDRAATRATLMTKGRAIAGKHGAMGWNDVVRALDDVDERRFR